MIQKHDLTIRYLIGAALALKLGYLFFGLENGSSPAALSIDALYHYKWASLIASGDLFANTPYFRAPFYPYVLGLLLKISNQSLMVVRLFQMLIGCLTLLLIYRLSREIFSKTAAILAFIIYLLYPITTYFEGELLLDSLFTLLALATLYCITTGRESRGKLVYSGLFFALAALTRPTILVFFPIALFYLHRYDLKQHALGFKHRSVILFSFVVLLTIAPVTLINFIHSGRPILISYQGGVNFFIGNNQEADGLSASLPPVGKAWDIKDADYLAWQGSGEKLRYDRQSSYWYGQGIDFIISDPVGFLKLTGKKLHFLFSGHEISNNRPLDQAVFANEYLKWFPMRVIFIIPLSILPLFLIRSGRRDFLFLYGVILFYGLIVALFFVTSRFRLPLLPFLTILAGGGISALAVQIRSRQFGSRLAIALLAVVAIFALGRFNPYEVSLVNPRQALFLRGNMALRQADYTTAASRFDSLALMTPYLDNAYLNLGIARLKQGHTDAAREAFNMELVNNPGSAEAANNLGVICLLREDYDSTSYYCGRALDIKPYYEEAAINLLRCGRNGTDELLNVRIEERRRRTRSYLADSPSYLFEEGLYFSALKRFPEAIDNHLHLLDLLSETKASVAFTPVYSGQSVLDRNSLPALANYQLGYLYGLTGDLQNSIHFSRRAIELNDDLKEAYINLINGYRFSGNTGAADSLISIFKTRWPEDF
ncbi:MAG: tetratricopeptide repeat protein [FCB group bacterium]|nr:tetratricopeptide repeat protein [FCB group bacterium]